MEDLLHEAALDVAFVRAKGCELEHVHQGKRLRVLDLAGGFGAAFLGHNPPRLKQILRRNLDQDLPFVVQGSKQPWSQKLRMELASLASESFPGERFRSHLFSTGSEAVDAALRNCFELRLQRLQSLERQVEIRLQQMEDWTESHLQSAEVQKSPPMSAVKQAVRERFQQLKTEPPILIALKGAYHGSTALAKQVTHGADYQSNSPAFGQVRFHFVPCDQSEPLESLLEEVKQGYWLPTFETDTWVLQERNFSKAAAFLFEPIQGEGGVHPIAPEVAQAWRGVLTKHQVPMIADEIQTGLGRIGDLFACLKLEVKPDLLLLSKTLGGGMVKISALIGRKEALVDQFSLRHLSTFGGDDGSSRIALEVLRWVTEKQGELMRRAERMGRAYLAQLKDVQKRWPEVIREVRGQGMMFALEFQSQSRNSSMVIRNLCEAGRLDAVAASWLFWQAGIRVIPSLGPNNQLRMLPPVHSPAFQLRKSCRALDRLCALLAAGNAAALLYSLSAKEPEFLNSVTELRLKQARWNFIHKHRNGAMPVGPAAPMAFADNSAPQETVVESTPAKVLFFGHWSSIQDLNFYDPSLAGLSSDQLESLSERSFGRWQSFRIQEFKVRSSAGKEVWCRLLGFPAFTDSLIRAWRMQRIEPVWQEMQAVMAEASEQGYSVAGFGASTSIITQNCRKAVNANLAVTSGNSLTVATALQALEKSCRQQGLQLAKERVAILGANGNIGRTCARLLADRADSLLLIGRSGTVSKLQLLAEEIRNRPETSKAEIQISTDLSDLASVRVILTATNAREALIHPHHISLGPVVLQDLAVPGDAAEGLEQARPNLLKIRGGLLRFPSLNQPSKLALPGWNLKAGETYACLAETLVLALEGIKRNFSCGELKPNDVDWIWQAASRHGFELAGCKSREVF